MKLTRNIKAVSKLLLILLLLTTFIIGAILSYLWVIGYYTSLEQVYPEDITVNITNCTFDYQNTTSFNVTIQNPTSYESQETATINQIMVSTKDGVLQDIIDTDPPLPYKFQHKGESKTFKCLWNWANYTGETVKIIAFNAHGSGPTFEAETPLVDLEITDSRFDSAISVTHFNITVQNWPTSATYVNITEATVNGEAISASPLPYPLDINESVSLTCTWNWTDYQDKNVTVAVHTLQGYVAYHTTSTPKPVILNITKVLFDFTNSSYFNITIQNSEDSPTYINVTRITVTMENQTVQEWTVENGTEVDPNLPYPLNPNSSQTFSCSWNWTNQRDKNVTITVYTLQDFTMLDTQVTPAPIMLEVDNPIFYPVEPDSFNVTVKNSEFSLADANITGIIVTVGGISENITDVVPTLQGGVPLPIGTNQTFICSWNWTEYSGRNVTVVVETSQGYSAYSSPVIPVALTITAVLFNPVDTYHFIVTLGNPTGLDFNITAMNGTVEMLPFNITVIVPSLPSLLPQRTYIMFMCEWNWTDQRDKNVTITIATEEGYITSSTCKTPPSV